MDFLWILSKTLLDKDHIRINMELIKLEIFGNFSDNEKPLLDYIRDNLNLIESRDRKINTILNASEDNIEVYNINPALGNFYDEKFISVISLSNTTHIIHKIEIDTISNKYFGYIELLDTPQGKSIRRMIKSLIDKDFAILRPVYDMGTHKLNSKLSEEKIVSFFIDYTTNWK